MGGGAGRAGDGRGGKGSGDGRRCGDGQKSANGQGCVAAVPGGRTAAVPAAPDGRGPPGTGPPTDPDRHRRADPAGPGSHGAGGRPSMAGGLPPTDPPHLGTPCDTVRSRPPGRGSGGPGRRARTGGGGGPGVVRGPGRGQGGRVGGAEGDGRSTRADDIRAVAGVRAEGGRGGGGGGRGDGGADRVALRRHVRALGAAEGRRLPGPVVLAPTMAIEQGAVETAAGTGGSTSVTGGGVGVHHAGPRRSRASRGRRLLGPVASLTGPPPAATGRSYRQADAAGRPLLPSAGRCRCRCPADPIDGPVPSPGPFRRYASPTARPSRRRPVPSIRRCRRERIPPTGGPIPKSRCLARPIRNAGQSRRYTDPAARSALPLADPSAEPDPTVRPEAPLGQTRRWANALLSRSRRQAGSMVRAPLRCRAGPHHQAGSYAELLSPPGQSRRYADLSPNAHHQASPATETRRPLSRSFPRAGPLRHSRH